MHELTKKSSQFKLVIRTIDFGTTLLLCDITKLKIQVPT